VAQSFNHMAAQVQAMLDEQRAFASNAAHELRTPLTTIRLRTELLTEDNIDPDKQRTYLLEIDHEVKRLTKLVDDVMLLSRVEAGRITPGDEHVDLLRLARKFSTDMENHLAPKNLRMEIAADEDSAVVIGSLTHLRIVFQNLLDNAVKYSPEGGTISWVVSCRDGFVESRIVDAGIGLSVDEKAHIFERFYRAEKSHSREVPGNGLGLSLVKKVVEIYGGSIDAESEGHGKGTTFIVRWPQQMMDAMKTH